MTTTQNSTMMPSADSRPVKMGDALTLPDTTPAKRRGAPGLLVPWMAAGLGLAVLAVVPNDGSTEPAGAASPPRSAAQAVSGTLIFAESMNALPLAPPTERSVAVPNAATVLDLGSIEWGERLTRNSTNVGPSAPHASAPTPNPPARWAARSLGQVAGTAVRSEPTSQQWGALRWCESSNDYSAVNDSGRYRGAYQFDLPTWESVGGVGDPAASEPAEQDLRARVLFERRGSSPWPFCGKYLEIEID